METLRSEGQRAEATTDSSGWATITFNRQSGYPASSHPASSHQQLLAMFVRGRGSRVRTCSPASRRGASSRHTSPSRS